MQSPPTTPHARKYPFWAICRTPPANTWSSPSSSTRTATSATWTSSMPSAATSTPRSTTPTGGLSRKKNPKPPENNIKSQFIGNSVDFLSGIFYFWQKSQYTVNTEEIGKAIRDRRKALQVRQEEIAGLSEVGINTLVAIERGQSNPKLRTLLSILDTLGLELTVKLKD